MSRKKLQYLPGAILLSLGSIPLLAQVSIPNVFQAGETAVAEEVNANFQALETALNDALQRIETLESSDVAALDDFVEIIADPNNPNEHTVLFSGVNVQIVNGLGDTESVNGLGNLIIGYNEARTGGGNVCSDGQYGSEADCTSNSGVWGTDHKSGSHNVVVGIENAYSRYGGLVVGRRNVINRDYASVSGGWQNVASGQYSSVSGGFNNTSEGLGTSISGGQGNTASGGATGFLTVIGGSVSGGLANTASGQLSSVSGGQGNEASGLASSILGGGNQDATGDHETIPAIE